MSACRTRKRLGNEAELEVTGRWAGAAPDHETLAKRTSFISSLKGKWIEILGRQGGWAESLEFHPEISLYIQSLASKAGPLFAFGGTARV